MHVWAATHLTPVDVAALGCVGSRNARGQRGGAGTHDKVAKGKKLLLLLLLLLLLPSLLLSPLQTHTRTKGGRHGQLLLLLLLLGRIDVGPVFGMGEGGET